MTSQVPTRANSPSDVAFLEADSATGGLRFLTTDMGSFTALNSVQPGGIHASPNQFTGGDGPVMGEEMKFDVSFTDGLLLPANHYFFVPQVEVMGADGNFFWLSAPKPITGGTGPFVGDLQTWTRDERLDPDWLRVGADIVGGDLAPAFNASFSLEGSVVPEPSTWAMMLIGFAGLGFAGYRHTRRASAASA
jgi:hypothetical protein